MLRSRKTFSFCDVNVWLLGPGSQDGQQESVIFKLHRMEVFAVYGDTCGQEILPFDANRNMVKTCELAQLKMFWAQMWTIQVPTQKKEL